jgi:hypothetical protein
MRAAIACVAILTAGACVNAALTVGSTLGCPNFELVTLPIDLVCPEHFIVGGPRRWQFAVCAPQVYTDCPYIPASYIIEIDDYDGLGCDVAFNVDATYGAWAMNYGGLNNFFTGTSSVEGDRIANVTLICDPSFPLPFGDGPVIVHSSAGGSVWTFDIRVKGASVCSQVPPPPSIMPPAPPPAPIGGIVLTAYPAAGCPGGAAGSPFTLASGCISGPSGNNTSTLRFCAGQELRTQTFNTSSECAGAPSSEDLLQMGACYPMPLVGGSVELTSCS